jgi:4-hydroxy-2-oxoheptanedioate aldolase
MMGSGTPSDGPSAGTQDDLFSRRARIRELWRREESTLGGWCMLPASLSAEVLASAGFDWVCVDLQHGLISYAEAREHLLALDARRVPALVRVSWNEPQLIMRMLDAGAAGVIVPMVNSPGEAAAAVNACRYPPKGSRSWGPTRVNERWRAGPAGEPDDALCVVMVETEEAVAVVDEIASVEGLDAILVGPRDLALSGSRTAEDEREHEEELMGRIVRACKAAGVLAGIACEDDKSIEKWFGAGFRMFGLRSDVRLLTDAAAALVRETSYLVGRTAT